MLGLKSRSSREKKRKIILHVGGPKCASSTLQTYLTEMFAHGQNVDRSDAKTARYFVIHQNGRVFEKKQLTNRAARMPTGYAASMGIKSQESEFEQGLAKVLQRVDPDEIPILSCESWFHYKFAPNMVDIFDRLNVEVEVFAVIRPPLDYLNSSWWQWGVWSKADVPKFMRAYTPATLWHRHLAHWKNVPGVTRLEVVDLRHNVLDAFKTFLGASDVWNKRSNSGSSAALLEFLLSQPDFLGRKVHDPAIEFYLSRFVPLPPCPKPFVLGPRLQQRLINATKDSVYKNRPFLQNEEDAEAHVNDPAYSSVEYYEGRTLRGMKNLAWPIERYQFRVALSEYLHANPMPDWMPKSFDLAALDEEIRVGSKRFAGRS